MVELAKEPKTEPLSGEARRGLDGVDTDRGKVIAEEGPEMMERGRQNDHEETTMTVGETCAHVNVFAQETNDHGS